MKFLASFNNYLLEICFPKELSCGSLNKFVCNPFWNWCPFAMQPLLELVSLCNATPSGIGVPLQFCPHSENPIRMLW